MKCLVVGPSWVGDMVISQALYIALKEKHPHAVIDILAPAWSLALITYMPQINRGIEMPIGHGQVQIAKRRRIGISLRSEEYTHAIVLPNSFKSALIPWWANIPVRIGWHGEMRYGVLNDRRRLCKKKMPRMIDRYVALAYGEGEEKLELSSPTPRLHVTKDKQTNVLKRYNADNDSPILGLCPGSEFGSSKCWPAEYYGEIAATVLTKGWKVWIFGSSSELGIASSMIDRIPKSLRGGCLNWVGKTSLSDAIDLISLVTVVISNDSGLMHVSAALDRIVLGLYGSTSERHSPPLCDCAKSIFLDLDCRPCFKRDCPLGHHNCMKQLTPSMVMESMNKLLATENKG